MKKITIAQNNEGFFKFYKLWKLSPNSRHAYLPKNDKTNYV